MDPVTDGCDEPAPDGSTGQRTVDVSAGDGPDGCGFTALFKPKPKHRKNSDDDADDKPMIGKDAMTTSSSSSQSLDNSSAVNIPQSYLTNKEFCYTMTHPRRGKLTIISNKNFLPESTMHEYPRDGTEYDVENLRTTFRHLGFDCEVHEDKTKSEMLNIFINASRSKDFDCDCMAFAILSHGADAGMIYAIDDIIPLDCLLAPLKHERNMEHFAGKPKLVFVQACRGSELDYGVEVPDSSGEAGNDSRGPDKIQTIPIEADFLYMYSSAPGYFSFRGQHGSVFIGGLCEKLREYHATEDLLHIMTRVNHTVAYTFQSLVSRKNPDHKILSHKKQMPTIVSMLTKDVYFVPKQSRP